MFKNSKKNWGLALISVMLLAAFVLSACTTPTAAPTSAAPTTAATTEAPTVAPTEAATTEVAPTYSGILNVRGFSQGDEIATERVKYALEQLKGVNVVLTEGSLDKQQFLTSVASGKVPDLIYISRSDIGTYAGAGALLPLDEACIAKQNIDMTQYYEAAVAQDTLAGKIYGIPEFYNIITVLAGDESFAEAGLTPADLDLSNWDKIAEINTKLTKFDSNHKVTKIGFDPKLPEFLPLWVAANGGSMLSADGKTATLNDPKVVEALTFTVSLIKADGGFDDFMAFRNTWDFWGGGNEFVAKQVGAFPMEQWYVNVLNDSSPDLKLTILPFLTRDGKPISFETGNTWAIPAGSKNVDAACAFARTMTSPEAWRAAATARANARAAAGKTFTGVYSGNKLADKIIFGDLVKPSGNATWDNAIKVLVDAQASAISIPASPASSEFQQAWQDAVNRVLSGKQTVDEALDQAQTEAQAALDKAWAQVK